MSSIFLYLILFFMVVTAILCVITDRLFTAVVYSGTLSVFTTLCYLLLGAPDVALAEAVIGATVASAIFLITLKKYHIFTVYFVGNRDETQFKSVMKTIVKTLKKLDIEPNVLTASKDDADVFKLFSEQGGDLVVMQNGEIIELHGERYSSYFTEICSTLQKEVDSGEVVVIDSLYDSVASYREVTSE